MELKEVSRDHFGLPSQYYNKSLISMAGITSQTELRRIEFGQSNKPLPTNYKETSRQKILFFPHLKLVSQCKWCVERDFLLLCLLTTKVTTIIWSI